MNLKKLLPIGILVVATFLNFGIVKAQCPEIWQYESRNIDLPNNTYDTVVNCANPEIQLQVHYYFTPSDFNGNYEVEEVPYVAPDRSLCIPANKLYLPADDIFDSGKVVLPFKFAFFGEIKQYAVVGANGMVTFNPNAVRHSNGYSNTGKPIPWPGTTPPTWGPVGSTGYPEAEHAMMRDAIYGVMCDVHPGILQPSYTANRHGIFRGVSGEYPCRYGYFIWDSVPMFSDNNKISDFYIKFFEGTNIIEVHVNHYKKAGTSEGIVGIQDANGTKAFFPQGYNTYTGDNFSNKAWRFTPQGNGEPRVNLTWFKLSGENLQDSIQIKTLSEYVADGINDPTEYLLDRANPNSSSNSDTILVTHPTEPTKYCCRVKYIGSSRIPYILYSNFFVDVDTTNVTNLTSEDQKICHGALATIHLEYPTDQELQSAVWSSFRILNGQRTPIDETRCTYNANNSQMILASVADDQVIENHIDSTIVFVQATYTNGCTNNDSILIQAFPNFAFVRDTGICKGETLEFCDREYTTTCVDSIMLQSKPGCDSLEILNLTVYDVSHTTDNQKACEAYTWPNNNETYTASTNAPIVTLKNKYQCDSIVNLNLEIIPVIAQIGASPASATLDELNIRLTDISLGSDSCLWIFPDGNTSTSPMYNYPYPKDEDSVQIGLEAISPLGCSDTTYITIPLLRESIWVPNIFCPTAEAPNNRFAPQGIGITYLNVLIFNRRGEQVAQIDGINDYWDGTTEDGRLCPQGTYVYTMRYRNVLAPESTQIKTGTITLLR